MKVSVELAPLAKAVKAVGRFLPHKTMMAVLDSILVEAEGDRLALTATDIESGRRIEVEATVQTEGRLLAPSSLIGVVTGAGGERLELTADDTKLTVSDSSASWTLRLNNADDYPGIPRVKAEGSVPVEDWSRARAIASFAQPRSGNRPACQGVLFEAGHAIATDTYQAAITPLSAVANHPSALIPANAVAALDAAVSELRIGDRSAEAVLSDGRWWSRLIDGQFPRVRKLIDDQPPALTVFELDTVEMGDVLRRATVVGNADWPVYLEVLSHGIEVTRREQSAVIFRETIMGGISEADVDDETTVAINPTYLRNILGPVSRVRLGIAGPMKMFTFAGAGEDEGWWSGGTMPVRT